MVLWVVSVVFAIGFSYADGSLRAWLEKVGGGGPYLGLWAWAGGRVCVSASPSLPSTPPMQLVRSANIFYDHRNRPYFYKGWFLRQTLLLYVLKGTSHENH